MSSSAVTDPLFLGIDLGTSSVKVVTLDGRGEVQDSVVAPYEVRAPHTGWAETPAPRWWAAVVTACAALPAASRQRCAGIGLSGQMHGVVLVDADVRPLRPAVLHADTRAVAELERYRDLPPDLLARLANPLSPNMAGPVLLWLAEHEPERFGRARWALQPKDWLRWQLTGQVASEPSDASATLLYDVVSQNWADDVVNALGLPRHLLAPLLGRSDRSAGPLGPEPARTLGLPPGVPVAAGGGDTAVAALGSGLLGERAAQLTIGTGGQIVAPLPAGSTVTTDPLTAGARLPVPHLYRDVADGWYAMAAVLNAGLALDWVRRSTGAGWPELYESAATTAALDGPLFIPHLTGERTPHLDPSLRASWSGLQLSHTRSDLLRAALEGVAFNLRDALDALPGPTDLPLRVAGGGTADAGWRQLLADVLQRPLQPLAVSGASARGAAVLGALAAGSVTADDVHTRWSPALGPPTHPRHRLAPAVADRRERWTGALAALRR